MPTYEYECTKCGHEFELFQSITEEPRKRCPKCRGKVRRLLGTGAGILFKGSGFYQTDYRSESYRKGAADDKPTSTSTGNEQKAGSKQGSKKSSTPSSEKK